MERTSRLYVVYLSVQSILVAVWWMVIATRPDVRDLFRPVDAPDLMLMSFWLADMVCVASGSAIAAFMIHRREARRLPALWFTSGAMVYATLYCIVITAMTGEAILGMLLMAPATAITVAIARAESK